MTDNRDLGRRLKYILDVAKGRPAKRPRTLRCAWCKAKIRVKPQGRLPLFCSHSCRQRAYEQKKWQKPHLVHLRRDLASIAMREAIRREAWELLRQMGLVEAPEPPEKPRGKQPHLKVVEPSEGS